MLSLLSAHQSPRLFLDLKKGRYFPSLAVENFENAVSAFKVYRAGDFVEVGRFYCLEEPRQSQPLVLAQMHQAVFFLHTLADGVLLGEHSQSRTLFDGAQQTNGFPLSLDQHFNYNVLGRFPEQILIVLVKIPSFFQARLGLVNDLFLA